MERPKLDYNKIAGTYHHRYDAGKLDGIEAALMLLAPRSPGQTILEVGSGTGRWIESLRKTGALVFGADSSTGMIEQASKRLGPQNLVVADANRLPFAPGTFDLVFVVNAIHHFDDPAEYIVQSRKLLRPNGSLAIIGIDPRAIRHRYYYDYFKGALTLDLERYPSFGELVDGMIRTGFNEVELRIVERYDVRYRGKQIFEDPFLTKSSNSLLALLDDETYANGLKTIEAAVEQNPQIEFRSRLGFGMISGFAS